MADTRQRERPLRAPNSGVPTDNPTRKLNAERQIEKLQDSIRNQKQQIRALHVQIKVMEGAIADQTEIEAELADLKSEVRELTRANREHVRRNEVLQTENSKLRRQLQVRTPAGARTVLLQTG